MQWIKVIDMRSWMCSRTYGVTIDFTDTNDEYFHNLAYSLVLINKAGHDEVDICGGGCGGFCNNEKSFTHFFRTNLPKSPHPPSIPKSSNPPNLPKPLIFQHPPPQIFQSPKSVKTLNLLMPNSPNFPMPPLPNFRMPPPQVFQGPLPKSSKAPPQILQSPLPKSSKPPPPKKNHCIHTFHSRNIALYTTPFNGEINLLV